MNIWFTDLDNTLIYSFRHDIPEPKLTAEYYLEREQSYVTRRTLTFLQRFSQEKDNLLIPVTTRTQQQYERIAPLLEQLTLHYALVENGAVLLDHGTPDESWETESLSIVSKSSDSLSCVYQDLFNHLGNSHLHDLSPYMVFAKTEKDPSLFRYLKNTYTEKGISILYSGSKLYGLPSELTKGNAIKRLCQRLQLENCCAIASGDSVFDLSMLSLSDIALYPESFSEAKGIGKRSIPVSGFFSDGMCHVLEDILSIQ